MRKTTNRKVIYKGRQYEIFWVTEFALHIERRRLDPSHQIDLKEVELFIEKSKLIPWKGHWLGLGRHNGKYYMAVVYLVEKPRRAVVKTCYVVSEPEIIYICKQMGI